MKIKFILNLLVLLLVTITALAQVPAIMSLSPNRNEIDAPRTNNVAVTFNHTLINSSASQSALKIFSAQRGGLLNIGGGTTMVSGKTITFNPTTDFKPGETVQATITTTANTAQGNLPTPQVYQFRAAAGPGPGIFQLASTFTLGTGPMSLASGDVDGDGDLDFVSASYGGSSISVRFNNGSGIFSGSTEIPVSGQPLAVKLADLDGDGDLDMIIANSFSPATAVSVRFNNGTGAFSGGADYAMDLHALDIALGDVDGDGDLDMAIAQSRFISLRLNDGAGNFSAGSDEANLNNISVVFADMDNDGDLDLAVNTQSSLLLVRFNNGAGVFSGTVTYPSNSQHLAAGDVDGDGDVDLLASGQGSGGIFLFRNNGAGALSSTTVTNALSSSFSVTLADIDGDGDLDVLSGSFENDKAFTVLRNDGTGTFGTATRYGSRGSVISTGDWDNDGDLDVLQADPNGGSGNTVSVLPNAYDVNLASLALSSGTLSPVFASASTSYTAAVSNATSSISLTPTLSDATATITVNGIALISSSASSGIPLSVGSNTITTVVTAQDGVTTKTYTVTVTRAASVNANLASLALSSGTLSPVFASASTSYTASVSNATSSITLTPTLSDATATITVNGIALISGSASSGISLSVGSNTITTVLTAQDGVTTKTYTVTVTRAASVNANLASLALSSGTLSPVFASASTSYTASVGNATSSINLTPTLSDATATITVNGIAVIPGSASSGIPLSVGSNTITTVITAQDGVTTKTYTVTVTRAASVNADLTNLALSSGTLSPVFASASTSYTASVSNATSSITLTPTLSDAMATVTVNGTAATSGSASSGIPLSVGNNIITTVVTAQDGTTTKTYTVLVNRAAYVNDPPTLAAIANQTLCYSTAPQSISLSGLSSGTESTQTVTLSVTSTNMGLFENLAIVYSSGSTAILNYKVKDGQTGTSTVTVTVKDSGGTANGGNDIFSRNFTITVNALPVIIITSDLSNQVSKGATATLTATGGITYRWDSAEGITSNLNSPILTVRPKKTTTYRVTVTNANNCVMQQEITIQPIDDFNLTANNVITPNGDERNDLLVFTNLDLYPVNNLRIFDRAGRVLYRTNNYQNDWNGFLNGNALSEDTYYYLLDVSNGKSVKKGFINIIRKK